MIVVVDIFLLSMSRISSKISQLGQLTPQSSYPGQDPGLMFLNCFFSVEINTLTETLTKQLYIYNLIVNYL